MLRMTFGSLRRWCAHVCSQPACRFRLDVTCLVILACSSESAMDMQEQCHLAMKAFLCTLYNRPCNATWGEIKPVCMYDCLAAYEACGFSVPERNLQCSEYLKAGWVVSHGLGLCVLTVCESNNYALMLSKIPILRLASADVRRRHRLWS